MHIGLLSDPNNFHTKKWYRGLQNAGADVTVFSFSKYSGNELRHRRISPGAVFNYWSFLSRGKALRDALIEEEIDVLNALNVTPYGVWARKSQFRPFIVSAIGTDIFDFPPSAQARKIHTRKNWANTEGNSGYAAIKSRILLPFYRRQVSKTLQVADHIFPDNHSLKDAIHDWHGVNTDKISLIRMGIERREAAHTGEILEVRELTGLKEGEQLILAPRGAKAIYQPEIILKAFRKVLDSQSGVRAVMLSAGYDISGHVRKVARELEKKYAFRFIEEEIPSDLMPALWTLSHCFVSAPVYDGYSASVAEGRYFGSIPVVNSIPGNKEVIREGEYGFFAEPFTAENLATVLQKVLKLSSEDVDSIKKSNRRWIEQHSMMEAGARKFVSTANTLLY